MIRTGSALTRHAWSLLAAGIGLLASGRAHATPTYSARTGFTCISCHFDPNGGGPRKEMGFLFSRQRHSLMPDTSAAWSGLSDLTNRVGDWLYFGTNTRMYYLYDHVVGGGPAPDISTFFQMQSAVYATVRPHSHLLLTWALDFNELSGSRTRDAYGMIDGLPQGLYLRAGRFRNPFGLRLDDHTAGTRYGFLNPPADAGGALPYDPREPQTGIELGAAPGPWFGSLAVQNANGAFFEDVHTVAVKWGFNHKPVQLAVSGYDSYHSLIHDRATRWGAYGLWGWRNLTLVAEAVGGEDRSPAGDITRVAGLYGELGYAFSRALALNGRWDFSDINRDVHNQARRWMAEGVWTAVPFADLRLSYRRIEPTTYNDENQILAMMHFYY